MPRITFRAGWLAVPACLLMAGCSLFTRDDPWASLEANRAAPDGDVQLASYEEEAPRDPLELNDLAPTNLRQTFGRLAGKGADPQQARQAYQAAQQLYAQAVASWNQGNAELAKERFRLAAKDFRAAAARWPDSTLRHDALFMQAESHFFADEYKAAEELYALVLKEYPNSKHLDRIQPRRFAIATYWLTVAETDPESFHEFNFTDAARPHRDTFGHAIRVLDRIRIDDPTGKLADDATLAMGNAFLKREDFVRADEYYTDLRKTFPSSEHQFLAHFLGLKCKLEIYQGPDYSAAPLERAEELLKQIHKQFPAEAERERETLRRAYAGLRFHQATREWNMARHYDQRGEHRAARFHYGLVLKDFDDTPYARRAQTRLQEIAGLPETPPERLSWLIDLFPEDGDDVAPVVSDETVRR